LRRIAEECHLETGGSRVKLAFGLTELELAKDETGSDLVDRATAFLQNESYF
jgi:hypothetical protein